MSDENIVINATGDANSNINVNANDGVISKRRRRKAIEERSVIWSHFKKIRKSKEGGDSNIIEGDEQRGFELCKCMYCLKEFKCNSTINGTSALWKHHRCCKKKPLSSSSNQTELFFEPTKDGDGSLTSWKFNQDIEERKMKAKDEEIQRIGKLNWILQERVKSLCTENQILRDTAQSNETTVNSLRKNLEQVLAEIQRIEKLNWNLEKRVESLCVENEIWRDLAQSNEVTVNSLRNNLEQVLAQYRPPRTSGPIAVDDAESSCGSSNEGVGEEVSGGGGVVAKRMSCRRCGREESSVLLLPCRHLCLCTSCGSTLIGTCPVCDSVVSATLHVKMSLTTNFQSL